MNAPFGPRVLETPVAVTARAGRTVTAVVPVRSTEPVLTGHYPGFPVLPGVCVIECAHRTALAAPPDDLAAVELTTVDSARFAGPVFGGDELTVELTWSAPDGDWCCVAEVRTRRGRVARVRLRYRAAGRPPGLGEPTPAPSRSDEGQVLGQVLGIDEITRLLPHRRPMLLLDRVSELVPGQRLTAGKIVSGDEPWYRDRPDELPAGRCAYPPLLLIESWCQAAGVLTVWDAPNPSVVSGHVMLVGSMTGVRLTGEAFPNDLVEHRVRLSRSFGDAALLSGESYVDRRCILRLARLMVAMRRTAELAVAG